MGGKSKCTRENLERVLGFLADGSAPFLSVAAERAGMSRWTVRDWICQVEQHETTNELMHEFAIRARKIRSDYTARLTRELTQPMDPDDRNSHHTMKHKAWLLERLERDLFDTGQRYLPKNRAKQAPAVNPVEPESMSKVLDELEQPEDLHEVH